MNNNELQAIVFTQADVELLRVEASAKRERARRERERREPPVGEDTERIMLEEALRLEGIADRIEAVERVLATARRDARTLAAFAQTAPGRLPNAIQEAVERALIEPEGSE